MLIKAHRYQHRTDDILYCSMFGNKTTISYLSVQQSKPLPRGAVDDPMHYCARPKATVYRVIHSTKGVIVLTFAQKGMKKLYTAWPIL